MKNHCLSLLILVSSLNVTGTEPFANVIVSTDAYSWAGDTIKQGVFFAYAPNDTTIISDYKAQPGYFMPIEGTWSRLNDISSYPQLLTPNTLHRAIYNMGLDEMVNAVEPDTTLRTGKEWSGVWTRDVSYSIILSMAQLQPEASMISLRKKITSDGRIMQDTGSGGAWPVSSDRMVWIIAAWEVYKATGDLNWIKEIFPVVEKSLANDAQTVYSSNGLVKGETSFIDWREQSYPKWMQPADIYSSESLSTAVVHVQALKDASEMAELLGKKELAVSYKSQAQRISEAVNNELWLADKGYYAMYNYGREFPILNGRAESLGESLAILFDVASTERAETITESYPTTPFGAPVFFPQISDMPSYHNNALWPFVASYWALANAKVGNEEGLLEAIGSVYRPAALFATNKENLNIDNGDIATELNSSNMLWSLAGNLAITNRILFGINPQKDGILFQPVVPEVLGTSRELKNYTYRGKKLDIKVNGWGNVVASISLNGKKLKENFIAAKDLKATNDIVIDMANNSFKKLSVNRTSNVKAPLTPIAYLEDKGTLLKWHPIEYIDHYKIIKDGNVLATTYSTEFVIDEQGEYMVIGVSGEGVESFASEPRNNREKMVIEVPYVNTEINSEEVSYMPRSPISGYRGNGFVESDRTSKSITVPVDILQSGKYAINLRYANGNGPVNTENKCAIRSFLVDGKKAGTFVMPQRGVGNWSDWGDSNIITVDLNEGHHVFDIAFTPDDQNMNIDTNHYLFDDLTLIYLGD